jgi:hypothetical protein
MKDDGPWIVELESLLEKLCVDGLVDNERNRLNDLLREGESQRHFYCAYMRFHGEIKWTLFHQPRETASQLWLLADGGEKSLEPTQLSLQSSAQVVLRASPSLDTTPAVGGFVSCTLPETSISRWSGWPAAYFAAMIIVGIGIAIASIIKVSTPTPIAPSFVEGGRPDSSRPAPLSPTAQTIGQITGMVDCKWLAADRSYYHRELEDRCIGCRIAIGDKFAIRSGLLEITYDAGAKVILQGPVRFEIQSPLGGFLSIGKLTARLEKGAKRLAGDASPQSTALNPPAVPLLTIATPMAMVTDIGTEFGVETRADGTSEVHVLSGAVDIETRSDGRHMRLDASSNHSTSAAAVRVERKSVNSGSTTIVPLAANASRFVRTMPPTSPQKPVSRVLVSSRFELSTEGWKANEPVAWPLVYARDVGNPGNCIQTREGTGPAYFYFIASPKFSGDRSKAFGGELRFDVFATFAEPTEFTDKTMVTSEVPVAILQGARERIAVDQLQKIERDRWNTLTVPLSAAGKWYRLPENASLDGTHSDKTPVSDEVIREVLSDLRDMWIRAEHMHGRDTGRLDNVQLLVPIAAPKEAKEK